MDHDKILLFGDSITQWSFDPTVDGWVASLSHAYVRKIDVINRGYSGYNSRWCRHILPLILRTLKPCSPGSALNDGSLQLVILFLGANDCVLEEFNQLQSVPLNEYVQNISEMLSTVKSTHPNARVLLLTPPPCHEGLWRQSRLAKSKPMDRTVESAKLYRDELLKWFSSSDYGGSPNHHILDVWETFFASTSGEYSESECLNLLVDGVHLTLEGNRRLYAAIANSIASKWPLLNPETFPTQIAWWDKVDPRDLPKSLFAEKQDALLC